MFISGSNDQGIPHWRHLDPWLKENCVAAGFSYSGATTSSLSLQCVQNSSISMFTDSIQGGVLCLLCETVANMAGALCTPEDHTVVGQSLNCNYLKKAQGVVTATATPVNIGKKVVVVTVSVSDSAGETVALATFTGSIRRATLV